MGRHWCEYFRKKMCYEENCKDVQCQLMIYMLQWRNE
jgi:hypothetical protein